MTNNLATKTTNHHLMKSKDIPLEKLLEEIPAEKLREYVEQCVNNHAANATDPAAAPRSWQKSAVLFCQCLRDLKVTIPHPRP